MRLPQIALNNYQFIIILVALGLFIGTNSLLNMPRSEDPNTDFPNYVISVVYPGTGPEDMEELIVDPLEEVLDEIDDIKEINTEIRDGLAIISVEALYGIDYEDKYDEIVREVNSVEPDLPEDIFSLDVIQFDPTEGTVIHQFALVSDQVAYNQLNDLAEELERRVERIPGVNKAEIHGIPNEEVRISLDFQKMAQQNISLSQVIGILGGNNLNVPGGDVKAGNRSFTIKSSGGYRDLDQIGTTVISANQNKIVYLRDISEITFDYEDQRWKTRHDGSRAAFVTVTQKEGENILNLSASILETANDFRSELPADVSLETAFEQARAVEARISNFFINLIQGIILVGVVILLFLGLRPSLVIMTVIPVSIMMAIGALDFSGYALQQISIAALVIALGLLVDNGIVVMENIIRFRKMGLPLKEAAIKGTSEVGFAIISSTVTTLLSFAPLAFMESGPGEYLRSLPVTVILVLSFSMILALAFTPILSRSFLSQKSISKSAPLQKSMQRLIEKVYRPSLSFALTRPGVVLLVATLGFVGSLALFPLVGVSFFPTADKAVLLIEVDTPEGSNLDRTDRAVRFVEGILDTTDYVSGYSANIGHGNPQIYYNRIAENYRKTHGQLLVTFPDWDPGRFYSTLGDFRSAFSLYPDAKITFRELSNGPPFEAPVEIKLIGRDLNQLKSIAADVERIMEGMPGTINVDNPLAISKTDLKVRYNRDKAGLIGLDLNDLDLTVRASIAGLEVDEVNLDNGEEYPMVVRLPFTEDPSIDDFNKVYFTTVNGGQVPLRQVARVEFEPAVTEILHHNLERSTAVTANVLNPDQTIAITLDIMEKLDNYPFPNGYGYIVGGEYKNQQESFGDLGKLLLVALIGIFAVLVLQFRSIKQPLIVFSAIPLAITGSFVALFITGWSFSFFAFVGFISLMGIVVNNSIILVDYTNRLMRQGKGLLEALKTGSETRFVPIVLTTTTTIVGLLPLTLSGTNLWSPLGWTIIGGMISSTFLTLFVVPVLFKLLTKEVLST